MKQGVELSVPPFTHTEKCQRQNRKKLTDRSGHCSHVASHYNKGACKISKYSCPYEQRNL